MASATGTSARTRLRSRASMHVLRIPVTLLLALALAACEPSGSTPAGQGKATLTAAKVFDGDSLVVRNRSGEETELRLFGIDAPERGQAYSNKAKQALQRLLGRQRLRMETVETDRYGRVVAVLYRDGDDESVNAQMVRQGFAWVYRRYNQDATMLALEEQAKEARLGLWADRSTPVPPWEWRQEQRR